jgi:predicted acylesterase/phospholipase RssA
MLRNILFQETTRRRRRNTTPRGGSGVEKVTRIKLMDPLDVLRSSRRIGLVLSGGSVRCAFQIGVLETLAALEVRPALCIAVSAGVWNGAALTAGTVDRLRHYWRAFGRMPPIDLRNLLRERSPYRYPEMHRRTFARYVGSERLCAPSAIPLLVGVTRLRDRQPVLFDARTVEDPFTLLLASNYLPPFYTQAPRIAGERYGDGGLSDNIPYERAFAEGCDTVIVVTMKGESEGGLYRSLRDAEHTIPASVRGGIVVIRPRHRLPVSFTERRWTVVREIIEMGRLRAREVLLGERHSQTDLRAIRPAPTVSLTRLLRLLPVSRTLRTPRPRA